MKYIIFVQCRQCADDLALKEIPEPKPEDPPLRHRSIELKCGNCGHKAVYAPSDMQLGEMDRPE